MVAVVSSGASAVAVSRSCASVNEYEEDLVSLLLPLLPKDTSHSMSYDKHAEAVEVFCQATVGICEESDRDLLGDWEGDGKTTMQTKDPQTIREPLQSELGNPLLDKHADIPEGKTLDDLVPGDMPVLTTGEIEEDEHESATATKTKKSKQKAKTKKKMKMKKNSVGA